MKKNKKPKETPVAQAPQEPQIDPKLLASVKSLRALATCHNLLDKGLFNHAQAVNVPNCLEFLRSLHEQVTKEALSHPDADKIQELKNLKDSQKEQANGQTK